MSSRSCFRIALGLALTACAAAVRPTPTLHPAPSATPTHVVLPTPTRASMTSLQPSSTQRDHYEVQIWFHNPEPNPGDMVTMFGSLLQNGFAIGGDVWMTATWPDQNAPGSLAVCRDRPNYARGICYIRVTEQYPVDAPVPITVTMHVRWEDLKVVGHGSFIPRGPDG